MLEVVSTIPLVLINGMLMLKSTRGLGMYEILAYIHDNAVGRGSVVEA
jgi:hypothetical protein